jgi:hypothetical protein
VSAECVAFVNDMAGAYDWADLVICRAGALTVAELAAAGVASLLVPFPHAVDDHQTSNARFLSSAGAAILLPQNQLTPERLAEIRNLSRQQLGADGGKGARAWHGPKPPRPSRRRARSWRNECEASVQANASPIGVKRGGRNQNPFATEDTEEKIPCPVFSVFSVPSVAESILTYETQGQAHPFRRHRRIGYVRHRRGAGEPGLSKSAAPILAKARRRGAWRGRAYESRSATMRAECGRDGGRRGGVDGGARR